MSVRARLAGRNPFPTGSATVGIWQVFVGLTAYGYLAVAARALGEARYDGLATMWALAFVAAPGFFLPIQQEVSRAIADRRARGLGTGPIVWRGLAVTVVLAGALSGLALVAGPWLVDDLFDGDWALLAGFVLVLVGYAFEHLARGVLAGFQRFGRFGLVLGVEGTSRLVLAVGLAAVGVATAGPYGLLVGVAPFLGTTVALFGGRDALAEGPPSRWAELSQAIGYLLVGSVLAQALMNSPPIAAQVLGGDDDVAGTLLNGLVVARIPLFLFQAVQATFLAQLAVDAGAGRHDAFRRGLRRLIGVVVAIGAAATLGAAWLGPWIVRTFFGDEYRLGSLDMALLAAASSALMLALALAQALIARAAQPRVAGGWALGAAAFGLALVPSWDVLVRVETAFTVGGVVAAAAMAVLLVRLGPPGQTEGSGHAGAPTAAARPGVAPEAAGPAP